MSKKYLERNEGFEIQSQSNTNKIKLPLEDNLKMPIAKFPQYLLYVPDVVNLVVHYLIIGWPGLPARAKRFSKTLSPKKTVAVLHPHIPYFNGRGKVRGLWN